MEDVEYKDTNDQLAADALDEALGRILAGEPLAEMEIGGPDSDLAALLAVAGRLEALRPTPEPAPGALAANRRRMIAAAAALRARRESSPFGWLAVLGRPGWGASLRRHPITAGLAAFLIFTATVGGGALAASGDSLPDSPLYPIKLAAEQVEIIAARDEQSRDELRAQFEERRRLEKEALDLRRSRSTREAGVPATETRPAATATSSATRAVPTETPEPGRTKEPEPTKERDRDETPTAGATATPRPTDTREPSRTPGKEQTPTPEPTRTPKREITPTAQRTATPPGTRTPTVTPTIAPSPSATPTGSPEPVATPD